MNKIIAEIARFRTVLRLTLRAQDIGFRPATNDEIDYVVIEGYSPTRKNSFAEAASASANLEELPVYDETFSGWAETATGHVARTNRSLWQLVRESVAMQGLSSQQTTIHSRLPFVIIFLILMAGYLVINLANFQFFPRSVRQEMERRGSAITSSTRRIPAERGLIYDRDGEPLAFNALQYRVGVSPSLVVNALSLSKELALILDIDEFELFRRASSDNIWEFIAGQVSAEQGQAIAALDEISLDLERIPKRFYPQGPLAGHVIGFVVDEELKGALGVEGAYNDTLAGRVLDLSISNIPLDLPEDVPTDQRGQDIVLTLDRDVQFWVESELERAVLESGAFRGSAIVMDPRNGDILAMANDPSMDPNNFLNIEDPNLLLNPTINEDYEPGSIVQVLTVAAGLETGAITPYWTYNDGGNLEVGGYKVWNRHFQTHGTIDVAQILGPFRQCRRRDYRSGNGHRQFLQHDAGFWIWTAYRG